MHLDQLAVNPDWCAARCKAEHGVSTLAPAFLDDLGNAPRDRAGDFIVLDDDYWDSFLGGWHSV
jgi:hypothetical protein